MDNNNGGTQAPFFTLAETLRSYGLCPTPIEGKKPRIKWKPYQTTLPTRKELEEWRNNFPTANIGIITGAHYGITVVDIDIPDIPLEDVFNRFGHTPLVVCTPRGGWHCYYAYNGERCTTKLNGENIDIKGQNGLIIAPPSLGAVAGTSYAFYFGSWQNVTTLPRMLENALETPLSVTGKHTKVSPRVKHAFNADEVIPKGSRNDFIFHTGLRRAGGMDSFAALLDILLEVNSFNCQPPLEEHEVAGITASLWNYKERGTLMRTGQQITPVYDDEAYTLSGNELRLLVILRGAHFRLNKQFALVVDALAPKMGLSPKTLRKAKESLIEKGFIKQCTKGGKYKGDPHKYKFTPKGLR